MYDKKQLTEIIYNNKIRDVLVEALNKLDDRFGTELESREWCRMICSCNDPFVQMTIFESKKHLFSDEDYEFLYKHSSNPTVHDKSMQKIKGFVAEAVSINDIKMN